MPINFKIAAAAENVLAHKALGVSVGDRLLHDLQQIAIFAANIDVTGLRANRESCDYDAFNHGMGAVLENQPVFARAWVDLIPIAQNVFRFLRLLRHERPLQPSVETRSAASTQSRILDLIHNYILLHG